MIDRIWISNKAIEVKEELLECYRKQLGQPDEVGRTEDNRQRLIELEAEMKELHDERDPEKDIRTDKQELR